MEAKIEQLVTELQHRYELDGQSLGCHLEGMLYAQYLNYWDYIQLPVLLNIQACRTSYPDEVIFIVYHQINELYFKLILHEIQQIQSEGVHCPALMEKLRRINRYMDNLIYSFDIVTQGFSKEQFLRFRTALAPASGFQSLQYRQIEIASTDLGNLVADPFRKAASSLPTELAYEHLYWKQGALSTETGKKDRTLLEFEKHFDQLLLGKIGQSATTNLNALLRQLQPDTPEYDRIAGELRRFDQLFNIQWRLSHFKAAGRHLTIPKQDLKGTGGTNWRSYLPPRFQKIVFFPQLWPEEEIAAWGTAWLEEQLS
ncbi:MAG TPA: tryptophan 2,3-dioxygenase family protein [Puia sp.]|uniref:tryptophan 2,3-dioxygenase family protein n=1 Tax=Puia sp. TaxID=2045100 RepID=UPI002B55E747|nr:tryptophan 2,3-dioxygenase family protein [Puia sp.]HVU94510.1 tryptophan 2,3-dioxygenase family protein [Puia sp.]